MGNKEQEFSNFIWDNLNELGSLFSRKAYSALSKYKNNNEKEEFETTLELLLEADKQLREKIDSYTTPDIEEMSIEEIVSALNISAYDDFTKKIKYIDRALYFIENYKKENEIYATLLNNLASLYDSKGEYDKAEPLYEKALEIWKKVSGEEHPDTATSYNNLASLYYSQGEYDKAEPLYKKTLEIYEKVLGENHPNTATSYNNLAGLYYSKGEYDKAEPLYENALEIGEKVLGGKHPDTAGSYNNLAGLYYSKGEYDKAEPLYKKALEIHKKVLGEEHSYTATSYNNLAELYSSKGEYDKAEALHKKALEIREKVLGEEHLNTATSYNNLANLYYSKGEYDKAEPLYKKALEIKEKVLGEEHPSTDIIYNNLVQFYRKNHDSKIDKIELKNFKYYSDFSMTFSKKINIIVGQNAIGKTSLLQSIAIGLLDKNSSDIESSRFERFIKKGKSEATIKITHNQGKEKELTLYDNRQMIKSYRFFVPFVLAYGSNFFTKYDISADKITQDILNETIHKEFAHSIFEDYVDEFWNPLTILNELDRSDSDKAKEKLEILLNTINDFLKEYKIVKKENYFYFEKNEDDTKLNLEDLSEGYRSNVLIITDMVVKILGVGKTPSTIRGVVLIDEFDKHLHPKWQSRLVEQLTKSFPYIQFIMTTHNPMSILDREAEEITVIKEIDGKVEAIRGRGTKQVDISVVLLEYFGVEAVIGQSMQKDIANFNRLKLAKKLNEKEQNELKSLEDKLSNTIASNFIHDRKYLKFLEFIKEHKDIDFDKFEKISDKEMDELLKDFGDFFND